MTSISRTAFVPFENAQMYALINDIEAYPRFLPWCEDAAVLVKEPGRMEARITVNKGRFRYSFTTSNRLEPERLIELRLVEGPFRKFQGRWRFERGDGGCLVSLSLHFEFSRRLLGAAMGAAFKPLADSMVDAFKQRAYEVYG